MGVFSEHSEHIHCICHIGPISVNSPRTLCYRIFLMF